jgi:methylenetetrahydrofolate--tRNA-(uracil-5-)-methyltransferase
MTKTTIHPVHIIGGGLAGCEAAWQAARCGVHAVLHEMRPERNTEAHNTNTLAELVCSNSLRSDDATNSAIGLLHEEMRRCNSLIMQAADANKVPAGGALAVDRNAFSASVEAAIENEPLISVRREEITSLSGLDWERIIVATGPLTSPPMAEAIKAISGEDSLSFFDALAPIVHKDSIDFSKAWFQSRYDKGGGADYINCPLSAEQYAAFVQGLLDGEKMGFKDWEKDTPYFEGCLPIEVMAERGPDTLAFGPLKPVGLTNPHDPQEKPRAVVQLRQDNALGTLYNMVGFQTKLTHSEQARLFSTIPGLEGARFARLGGIHRNTFINGPKVLDASLEMKRSPHIHLAGQITGCEGYVESAAIGLLAGHFAAGKVLKKPISPPPPSTALGALLNHITCGAMAETFQPMNISFGLFPVIEATDKRARGRKGRKARRQAICQRALDDLEIWRKNL